MENTTSIAPLRLKENNDFFGRAGIIGRWAYFKKNLLCSILGGVPLGVGGVLTQFKEQLVVQALGVTIMVFAFGFMLFVQFGLLVRRIKDIRRKPEDATLLTVGVLLFQCIPYLGWVGGLLVTFWPGEMAARKDGAPSPQGPSEDYEAPIKERAA